MNTNNGVARVKFGYLKVQQSLFRCDIALHFSKIGEVKLNEIC